MGMRTALFGAALVALAACSPQEMAGKVTARAAETVVRPVVARDLTAAQADAATACILANASPAEVQGLARDVAVEAGTVTEANIRAIAARPATVACLAAAGLPPLRV